VVWGHFAFNETGSYLATTYNYNVSSTTLDGLLIGLGLEYGITTNWTVKFEYDFLGFAPKNVAVLETCSPASACAPYSYVEGRSAENQIFKLGLNYKFDFGTSPVVARY
jgi:outer membrane immunogenic protein